MHGVGAAQMVALREADGSISDDLVDGNDEQILPSIAELLVGSLSLRLRESSVFGHSQKRHAAFHGTENAGRSHSRLAERVDDVDAAGLRDERLHESARVDVVVQSLSRLIESEARMDPGRGS